MNNLRPAVQRLLKLMWQRLDAIFLIIISGAFVIWSIFGSPPEDYQAPLIISLLGLLAFSQLRSRSQIVNIMNAWHRSRTDIFSTSFPKEYDIAKVAISHSYFYAGESMARTMPTMRQHIIRVLESGGSARILLPNPNNDRLMDSIAKARGSDSKGDSIKRLIEGSIAQAQDCSSPDNKIQIRTTDIMPHIGINGLDIDQRSGRIMIQMYEFMSNRSERAPIFILDTTDQLWYKHFKEQIERLWESGKPFHGSAAQEHPRVI